MNNHEASIAPEHTADGFPTPHGEERIFRWPPTPVARGSLPSSANPLVVVADSSRAGGVNGSTVYGERPPIVPIRAAVFNRLVFCESRLSSSPMAGYILGVVVDRGGDLDTVGVRFTRKAADFTICLSRQSDTVP
jgi:hypothetical protein